jgi:hypothetical protein
VPGRKQENKQPVTWVVRRERRDSRLQVFWPCAAEKIQDLQQKLEPQLAKVYERVTADPHGIGRRLHMTVRDISQNGAFLEGEPLPLLSRVALSFEIPGFGTADVVGWVLWRRKDACTLQTDRGKLPLPAGCGVLFEWMTLEARTEIARKAALLSA